MITLLFLFCILYCVTKDRSGQALVTFGSEFLEEKISLENVVF